jgi:DNA-binding MarR family transcriptional regulator
MTPKTNPLGDAYTYADRRRRTSGGFAMIYRDEIKAMRRSKLTGSSIALWLYLASKVSNNPEGWQVGEGELVEALEMPRSTLYRSLAQLLEAGFVHRERGANGRSWTRYFLVDPDPDLSAEEITKDVGLIPGTPGVPLSGPHKDHSERTSFPSNCPKNENHFLDYEMDRKFWLEFRRNNPPIVDLDPEAFPDHGTIQMSAYLDMYAQLGGPIRDLLNRLKKGDDENRRMAQENNKRCEEMNQQWARQMRIELDATPLCRRSGDSLYPVVMAHSQTSRTLVPRTLVLSAIALWRIGQ